jgi:Tol biopolymer transport system component
MRLVINGILFTIFGLYIVSCSMLEPTTQLARTPSAELPPPTKQQQLLFVSNQDGDREIFAVDFDGSNLKQLTFNNRDDYDASWSPDGDKILFSSNRDGGNSEVYLMNADGSEQTNLSSSAGFDGRARWSPDGKTIVFNSDRDGAENLYLLSINVRKFVPLPIADVTAAVSPAWSPDGQWLAYLGLNHINKGDIWLIKADGSQRLQLTNNAKFEDGSISWSPDGRKLAYHSRRNHQYNVFVYDIDLQQEFQITYLSTSDVEPKWSNDGKHLLFLSTRGQFGRTQLCLMKEDGSQQRCLTDDRHQIADAIWLNDGQGILHTNWRGTRYSNVFLLDVNSNQLIAVSPAKGYQSHPQPRPALLPNNLSSTSSLTASVVDTRRNL